MKYKKHHRRQTLLYYHYFYIAVTTAAYLRLYSQMSSVEGETEMKQMLFSASSVRFELSACYVSTAKFINAHFMQSLSSQAQTVW